MSDSSDFHETLASQSWITPIPDRSQENTELDLRTELFGHVTPPASSDSLDDRIGEDAAQRENFEPKIRGFYNSVDDEQIESFLSDAVAFLSTASTDGLPLLTYIPRRPAQSYLDHDVPVWCGYVTGVTCAADGELERIETTEFRPFVEERSTTTPIQGSLSPDPSLSQPINEIETWLLKAGWILVDHHPTNALRLEPDDGAQSLRATRGDPNDADIYLANPTPTSRTMTMTAKAPPAADETFESIPTHKFPNIPPVTRTDETTWEVAEYALEIVLEVVYDDGWSVALSQIVEDRYYPDSFRPEDAPQPPQY
jgi:hypothetical protein